MWPTGETRRAESGRIKFRPMSICHELISGSHANFAAAQDKPFCALKLAHVCHRSISKITPRHTQLSRPTREPPTCKIVVTGESSDRRPLGSREPPLDQKSERS